jgi:hypothetical protein
MYTQCIFIKRICLDSSKKIKNYIALATFDKSASKQKLYMYIKLQQSLYRPIIGQEGSRRLRLPDFEAMGI